MHKSRVFELLLFVLALAFALPSSAANLMDDAAISANSVKLDASSVAPVGTPSGLFKNLEVSFDSKSRIIAVCEELLWRQAFGAVGQVDNITALSQGFRLPLVLAGVDQQATKRYINYHGRSSSVHRLGSTAALKFEGLAAIQPVSSQVWRV